MSDWKFKFSSIPDFISGFEQNASSGLWCQSGKIDSFQINGNDPQADNYISIFSLSPGSRIRNLHRFSFTRSAFLNLYFSIVLPGLSLYLSEEPNKRNTKTWGALSDATKNLYITQARRLIKDAGFLIRWPIDPIIPVSPKIQIFQDYSFYPNGSTFMFDTTFIGSPRTRYFTIKNTGEEALTLTTNPIVYMPILNTEVQTFVKSDGTIVSGIDQPFLLSQPSLNFLEPNQSVPFSLTFDPQFEGTKSIYFSVSSDDPETPLYTISTSGISIYDMNSKLNYERTEVTIPDENYIVINSVQTFETLKSGEYKGWNKYNTTEYFRFSLQLGSPPSGSILDASIDFSSSDIDGSLCFFDVGEEIWLKNRTGSEQTYVIHRMT